MVFLLFQDWKKVFNIYINYRFYVKSALTFSESQCFLMGLEYSMGLKFYQSYSVCSREVQFNINEMTAPLEKKQQSHFLY